MMKKLQMEISSLLSEALRIHNLGNLHEAKIIYEEILSIDPENFDALNLLGVIYKQNGEANIAIEFIRKSIAINPKISWAYTNLGSALNAVGNDEEALHNYELALKLDPEQIDALYNKILITHKKGDLINALELINEAIDKNGNNPELFFERGNINFDLNKITEAINDYENTLKRKSNHINANFQLGNLNVLIEKYDVAINYYNEAIRLKINFYEAYSNKGNALKEIGSIKEAINNYKKSLEINPTFFDAYYNLGLAYFISLDYILSIENYSKAIYIKSDEAKYYVNRGIAYQRIGKYAEALLDYEKANSLNSNSEFLMGSIFHIKRKMCIWDDSIEEVSYLKTIFRSNNPQKIITPFSLLSIIDDPKLQRDASEIWIQSRYSKNFQNKQLFIKKPKEKIRIGYFSNDFHNHATSHLISGLFELHDQVDFEFYAFSFGENINDELGLRIKKSFKHFIDVSGKSDTEIASLSRKIEIDIAIDLKGFTQDSRPGVFLNSCAPIQVSYLGYPGTTASSAIDYLIADQIVIPLESHTHYSEKIVYLPNCYQVNDSKRRISPRNFFKQELGLPNTGFIFCCFNNNYKITPLIFDGWMRILKAVNGSILWLLDDNPLATQNLQKEASARGVNPKRLIFAKRMPTDQHLSRHKLADLFLDTTPCNAHTTASDALWAGLPLLTLKGESFAARVAASLLNTIGLPELITHTQEEYEAKAIEIATSPELLKEIKQKLMRNSLTTPLFNTSLFTKHIEAAYKAMYERYLNGLPTDHIYVNDLTDTFVTSPSEMETAKRPMLNQEEMLEIAPESATVIALVPEISTEVEKSVDTIISKNDELPSSLKLFGSLALSQPIQVMDVGASAIAEVPVYKSLLDMGLAHLNAFEGDARQIENIQKAYAGQCTIYNDFLFDGSLRTLYLATPQSGMSSLLKPREAALNFFNGFTQFGRIESTQTVQTKRLDDVEALTSIDFLKMDIQGAELTVLQNGIQKLNNCLAIQLEVSYVCLYEEQPSFGDVDVWMRSQGFVPHCFLDVKRWSIAPTIFNNNFRVPGNQLLESDILYIKDPLELDRLTNEQIIKLLAISHYCLKSYDLAIYLINDLKQKDVVSSDYHELYLKLINQS